MKRYIANIALMMLPFLAMRIPYIVFVTGYKPWILLIDIPAVALFVSIAILKTKAESWRGK